MRVFFENRSFDRLADVRLKKFKRHSIRREKLRYPCAFHVILNIFIFALRKVMKVDNWMFGTSMFNVDPESVENEKTAMAKDFLDEFWDG